MTHVRRFRTSIGQSVGFLAAAMAAMIVGIVPAVASAENRVATVVLYEVAEALMFKPKAATDPSSFTRRMAEATLLGKDILDPTPGTPFSSAQFMIANATSTVDLRTGIGPISGSFDLLVDADPTRNSLDTLVIKASAMLRGTLDLTMAAQGYAAVRGDYRFKGGRPALAGRFEGVFLIPFEYGGTYFYLDLGPQGTCASASGENGLCPLADFEFALGIPLTKAVLELFD